MSLWEELGFLQKTHTSRQGKARPGHRCPSEDEASTGGLMLGVPCGAFFKV